MQANDTTQTISAPSYLLSFMTKTFSRSTWNRCTITYRTSGIMVSTVPVGDEKSDWRVRNIRCVIGSRRDRTLYFCWTTFVQSLSDLLSRCFATRTPCLRHTLFCFTAYCATNHAFDAASLKLYYDALVSVSQPSRLLRTIIFRALPPCGP